MGALHLFQPETISPCAAPPTGPRRISTVRELFAAYLSRNKAKQAESTFAERERLMGEYSAFTPDGGIPMGDREITSLIADDLSSWLDLTRGKKKDAAGRLRGWDSDWTAHRIVNTIKLPFSWATRQGLLAANPFLSVNHPTGSRGLPVTDDELRRLMRKFKPVFRRVLMFAKEVGVRPCELSGLKWSQLDTTEGTATLHEHKTARTRKDKEARVVYLTDISVRLLIWIRLRNPTSEHVFLNSRQRPWNRRSLDLRIYRMRTKLGMSKTVRMYGLRHNWATRLAKGGVDLATLAKLLGHTSVRMAQHYIHLAGQTDYLREQLAKGMKKGRL